MSVFWWEEGYNEKAKDAEAESRKNLSKMKYDGSGERCLLNSIVTDLHHLDGKFFNKTSDKFACLSEAGKGRHQKSSSVTIYDLANRHLEIESSFTVDHNSGFMAISNDDKILAIGVLKCDKVTVYEVETGDLLINVEGGQRLGFWGTLYFLSGDHNNSLVELRVTEMVKSKTKSSIVRLWDLGFRPTVNEDGEESDDDEEESKLWEHKRPQGNGTVHYAPCGDNLLLFTAENPKEDKKPSGGRSSSLVAGGKVVADSTIQWVDRATGNVQHTVKCGKWATKTVVSKNSRFVAVGHFEHCTIYDTESRVLVGTIRSPDPNEVYPIVPIAFVHNDTWLVMRVNYNRNMLMCKWDDPINTMTVIYQLGGTISDNCLQISADEKFIMSWPFGYLELFDFRGYLSKFIPRKEVVALRLACIRLRNLVEDSRGALKPKEELSKEEYIISRALTLGNGDICRHILKYL